MAKSLVLAEAPIRVGRPTRNSFASAAGVPNINGTGTLSDVLNLTTADNSEATSYNYNTPQNITNFMESFTYTDNSTNGADGITAIWQNAGATALGGGGGNLGYSGIGSAAGFAMNIYSGNSGSSSGYNGTVTAGNPAATPTPGGVNIDSGDPINIVLSYKESDGALTESMTDPITSQSYTRVWRGISIQGQVGGTTAFVGFTGATGGVNAAQSITNFQICPRSREPDPHRANHAGERDRVQSEYDHLCGQRCGQRHGHDGLRNRAGCR